ncbi:MAG: hypothetical protein IKU40_00205 [Clostridia bacterium]|nr:hypothetical protein [Clostridia bacterium]
MKAAFYEREITPPLGESMPGYYAVRIADDVADKLYAKVFAAENDGVKIALLVLDCVELPTKYADAIVARVRQYNEDIPADNIAVCATHSHTGIPCGEPLVGMDDEIFMNVLVRQAADCVTLALRRLQEVTLTFGCGEVNGISFNRNFRLADGRVITHLGGADRDGAVPYSDIDPLLPILTVRDENRQPVGAVISYACHQDCVGGKAYSGDYSSELSKKLKERYGQDFVSVYIPGASGDINHVNYMNVDTGIAEEEGVPHYRTMGRVIAAEAVRVIDADSHPVEGNRIFAEKKMLDIPVRRATAEQIEQAKAKVAVSGEKAWNARLLLHYEEVQTEVTHPTPVQVFGIGNTAIAALPGEPYHRFAAKIREGCPAVNCLFSALSNGMHGYVPVPELMETDIYEAKLCEGSFLDPSAGDAIAEAVIRMLDGRRLQ